MFDFQKKKKTAVEVPVSRDTVSYEQIEESVKQFNKMCNSKLEDIWKIEDETNLVVALYCYIAGKCDYGSKTEILSAPERIFYICQTLESEINNGGFSQFYFNSSGDLAAETPDAFLEIGANRTSNIVRQANSLFENCLNRDRVQREEMLNKYITDEIEEKLNSLDNDFYKYEDDLAKLNLDYVIRNKKEFS
jgi:hypothetical protein